jgi:ArsR family transcriptional regulator, arsenate/arsenite/antimonite-responsive transcriptional repressor
MQRNLVKAFKALSDPNRLRILKMLEGRELCVCEVRAVLDLSVSTVSKHLTILRDADLISDHKDGKWVNYRLNKRADSRFTRALLDLVNASIDNDTAKSDLQKVSRVDRTKICGI